MEIAQLVLEYTKVLIWPVILLLCVFIFKSQILKLISKITELNLEVKGMKLKLQLSQKISDTKRIDNAEQATDDVVNNSEIEPSIIWGLSDSDFIFLEHLSNKDILKEYLPISKDEEYSYQSLSNEGLFTKQENSKFIITSKGRVLLEGMKKL